MATARWSTTTTTAAQVQAVANRFGSCHRSRRQQTKRRRLVTSTSRWIGRVPPQQHRERETRRPRHRCRPRRQRRPIIRRGLDLGALQATTQAAPTRQIIRCVDDRRTLNSTNKRSEETMRAWAEYTRGEKHVARFVLPHDGGRPSAILYPRRVTPPPPACALERPVEGDPAGS